MKIELLYFEGCPNHLLAMEMLRNILDSLSREEQIHQIEVRNQAEAEAIRFVGSPNRLEAVMNAIQRKLI